MFMYYYDGYKINRAVASVIYRQTHRWFSRRAHPNKHSVESVLETSFTSDSGEISCSAKDGKH